jgi:hypothetical protein
MQRQVSALLRRVRNPRALAAMPMMTAICAEMGTSNPVSALERVVFAVFGGDDCATAELRDAILKADFARDSTNSELARRCGVSRRHFQRRRAEAVAAIAHYARAIVERSNRPAQTHRATVVKLRPHATTTRFERERQAFAEARDRDAVLKMRAIAGNMLRLAEGTAQEAVASGFLADANVRLGRREDALKCAARLSPAARELLAARLALLAGDRRAVEAHARAALPLFDEEDAEELRCWCLLSQSAQWPLTRPLPAVRYVPDLWSKLALQVERARHLARRGSWSEAALLAREALRYSQDRSFAEIEAQSAALLQAAAFARKDLAAAKWWRALSVERLLPTQDRLLALTMAREDVSGRLGVDPLLTGVLYQRLILVVPQMGGENEVQAAAVQELLACLIDAALTGCQGSDRMERVLAAVRTCDSAFVHYCSPLIDAIADMTTLALTAVSGESWNRVSETVSDVLGRVVVRLQPVERRTFTVAPRSQPAPIVHFKVDDERSGALSEPVEALADLRLRLVSV